MQIIAKPTIQLPKLPVPQMPKFLRQSPGRPVEGRVAAGESLVDGLVYQGITYRYDEHVVFLGFLDRTQSEEGRPFSVWCSTPHRFAVRLDNGSVVDVTVDHMDGEAIEYHLHPVRRVSP